ncbi:hypothetical protein, partial [uncultured Ruegeria sp.]|uniref:hypothetical protein n=1 Tax=uncultured Ruegeria sp. TaxID=259304 RepID=UPI0026149F93
DQAASGKYTKTKEILKKFFNHLFSISYFYVEATVIAPTRVIPSGHHSKNAQGKRQRYYI